MRVLALNKNGDLTFCEAPIEERGKRRCNHIEHQGIGESNEQFIDRINEKIKAGDGFEETTEETNKDERIEIDDSEYNEIGQEEIDELAAKIDEIAGCKVTPENYEEVINSLPPEKVDAIMKISFDNTQNFSLPIEYKDLNKEEIKNDLYFASMAEHKVAGKMTAIDQMFREIGKVPAYDGNADIKNNYRKGLTPDEYFIKEFSARRAAVSKTVSVSAPGYAITLDSEVTII